MLYEMLISRYQITIPYILLRLGNYYIYRLSPIDFEN